MSGRYQVDNQADKMQAYINACKSVRKARKMRPGDAKPGDILPAIVMGKDGPEVWPMIWGFLNWDKKMLVYNIHAEAVPYKNSLKKLLPDKRVAIPSTGYYVWTEEAYTENRNKYLFREPGEEILYMAGLYNTFYHRGWPIRERFAILTTEANTSTKTYHNRMPVLLRAGELEDWLAGDDPERYLKRDPFEVESELIMANTGELAVNPK